MASDIDDLRAKIAHLDTRADVLAARVAYQLSELRGGLTLLSVVIDNPNSIPTDIDAVRQYLGELENVLTEMHKIVPPPADLPPEVLN